MQLAHPPKLLRTFPKLWAYPVLLNPWQPMPVFPGMANLLLGEWDIRDPLWPVKLDWKVALDSPKVWIPTLLVEETPPPGFRFTFGMYHIEQYQQLGCD